MEMCEEMKKFRKMLDEKGVKWEDKTTDFGIKDRDLTIHRTHFEYKGRWISVINGYGTYGGVDILSKNINEGLLECMKGRDTKPIGHLTAQQVYDWVFNNKEAKK